MTEHKVLELTQKAIEKDQLIDLFLGSPGYEWDNLKHIPANVNTDIGAIVDNGLYQLYNSGDTEIPQKIKETVIELLSGSPVEIWTAYQILWNQHWDMRHNQAPFYIVDVELSQQLKEAIVNNEEPLRACKELVAWNLKNGLLEDIYRLEKNLKNKYGVGII